MVKINLFQIVKDQALRGNKEASRQLIVDCLENIKNAELENPEVKDFLIEALNSILDGVSSSHAFYQSTDISGKSLSADQLRNYNIGWEVENCHNTLIDGKTPKRKRKTPLPECYDRAAEEHNISPHTAREYHKLFRKLNKNQ